jgi:hypothetical protein
MSMEKHFVIFYSPGTFVSETNEKPIDSWDVEKAKEMAKEIKQRYNAVPYGFYFVTRGRKDDELDSKVIKSSGFYYFGGTHGKLLTLEEIKAQNDPDNRILINNMENNNWPVVYQTTEGWKLTLPFNPDKDTLLD